MTRQAKPRAQRLILICVVALAVALLLLRMVVFVQGHGRRGGSSAPRHGSGSIGAVEGLRSVTGEIPQAEHGEGADRQRS